jgi:succinate dehydrogenase / fumarate reductase, iron-sulfur subunit
MCPSNASTSSKTYRFEILRYDAAGSEPPRFQAYELAAERKLSVLEALVKLQSEQDPSLAFRYSCRGAVCGSCAMAINGTLNLACRALLENLPGDLVVLEPLPHLEVLKDLVVDMEPFWEKYRRVEPWLHAAVAEGEQARSSAPAMSEAQRAGIDQYVNCVLCGLCYGACPVLSAREDFLGPAALAKLSRFVGDPREDRAARPLEPAEADAGAWGCRTITRCIDVCPKQVRPTDGVGAVRRRVLSQRFKRMPGAKREPAG